jgi:23S rRNA (uracil1939-C5)-methyltransferase
MKLQIVRFFVGDMKVVFNDAFHRTTVILMCITDPRDGMHKDVIEQIMKIAPAKVVYVVVIRLHKHVI